MTSVLPVMASRRIAVYNGIWNDPLFVDRLGVMVVIIDGVTDDGN